MAIKHDQYCYCDICKSIVSIMPYGQVRRTGSSYTAYNDDGEVAGIADSIEQAEALIASKPETADEFNARIWASADMAEAQRRVVDASNDLAMEGWGNLTLGNAKAHLVRAIELIDAMMASKGGK